MNDTQVDELENPSDISISRDTTINKPQVKIAKKLSEISIIRKIGTEFIGAFLGVLIALFVSNWRESYKQREFIGSIIQSIYLNNKSNSERVNIQSAHLKRQVDTTKLYLKDEKLTLISLLKKNNGLQTKILNFTGWQVLGRSQLISKVDYELVSALMYNNDQYDIFRKKMEALMGLLYEKPSSCLNEDKIRLLLGFHNLMNSSKTMEAETAKIDSLLKVKYPKLIADLLDEEEKLEEKTLAAQ